MSQPLDIDAPPVAPPLSFADRARNAAKSDFVRQVAETLGTRVLLIGVGVVTSVLAARVLGPEARGTFAVAMTIAGIGMQFGNFGLHASNTYFVSEDGSRLAGLTGNSLLVSFGFGIPATILYWLLGQIFPSILPVQGTVLLLALLIVPFGLASMLLQNLLLGIQEIRAYNGIEIATKILGVVLLAALLITKLVTIETVVAATLAVTVATFGTVMYFLMRHTKGSLTCSMAVLKDHLRFGMKPYFSSLLFFLAMRVNVLVTQSILGDKQAGLYAIAMSMADLLMMLPTTVGTIVFPKLVALKEREEKWKLARKTTRTIALIMLASCIAAGFLSESLLHLLYGSEFVPASPVFRALLPGVFAIAVQAVSVQYLNSLGFPLAPVIGWAVCAVFSLPVAIVLTSRFGIVGSALAYSSIAVLIAAIVGVLIVRDISTLPSGDRIEQGRS
ncbi:MAG TPA: flippase [Planctomycetota bacterium]|nr:flippase [Planctomycetota bacterium]